jgi:hypothetical protein
MDFGPVYVAGQERSGTSLMYALLASHPNIAMTRRTNLWTHFYEQYGDLSQPENLESCLSMMKRYKRIRPLNLDPERVRHEFRQGEATYGRLFAIIEGHYAERLGKPRWGDKSLHTERYAKAIFDAYPGARILHMIRDPRDRYASALTRWETNRSGVGGGAAVWLSSVKLANRNRERYPDRYRIVRYETLAREPENTLRNICDFIGEPFDPAMLTMQGAKSFRDEGGNSSYTKYKPGRITNRSIGRYRQVLSNRQIAFLQLICRQDMVALDYSPEEVHLSTREKVLFTLLDVPDNLARMTAWYLREAFLNFKGRPVPSYRIIREPETANATT